MSETLVVNLFAGPGTGKSTTAASVFSKLKVQGINCELAHEFAKDLTWEKRFKTLQNAPYVAGKQIHRIDRLLGEVECIITDTAIIYQDIYKGRYWSKKMSDFVHEVFSSWNNYNIYLQRDTTYRPYNPKGRNQSEEEAVELDTRILGLLSIHRYDFDVVPIRHGDGAAAEITNMVLDRLKSTRNV